ncbi:MAG: hypothetical protein ACRBN8_33460, partial [Nannocystales bacterium]
ARARTYRFPCGAAFIALRRHRAERLQPFPGRRDFLRALEHLGYVQESGSFVGFGPKDPETIKPAGVPSIAEWLKTRTHKAPDAIADADLAWADYARYVAPRVPSRRFYAELAALGYPRASSELRGFSLRTGPC